MMVGREYVEETWRHEKLWHVQGGALAGKVVLKRDCMPPDGDSLKLKPKRVGFEAGEMESG